MLAMWACATFMVENSLALKIVSTTLVALLGIPFAATNMYGGTVFCGSTWPVLLDLAWRSMQ